MNKQKFTILTLVLIASVIASPFVYAVVEPHIKITMDASQTTKPLQIVNNLDQEVFSVDVDGTVFPSQVTGFGIEEKVYDGSSFTGGTFVKDGSLGIVTPFTLPTTSELWHLTAVDVGVGGDTGLQKRICAFVVDIATSNDTFPITNGEYTIVNILSSGKTSLDSISGSGQLAINSIHRVELSTVFLEGGELYQMIIGQCGGSGNDLIFITAPDGTTTSPQNYDEVDGQFNNADSILNVKVADSWYSAGSGDTMNINVYAQPVE